MSVLLNLLNLLAKANKMQGMGEHQVWCHQRVQLNETWARMPVQKIAPP